MSFAPRVVGWSLIFFSLLKSTISVADLTVDTPAGGGATIASANDYATEALGNPWDMDSRADLAEYIFVADYGTGISNPSAFTFNDGLFGFSISTGADAYFHMLSPGQRSINPLGKNGQTFPIDTTRYRYLTMRMYTDTPSTLLIHWNTGQDYAGNWVRTHPIATKRGWNVYSIDLETAPIRDRLSEPRGWIQAGKATGLRLEPGEAGNLLVDWIRLTGTAPTYNVAYRFSTLTDTRFSLFVDNDGNPLNGNFQTLVQGGTATGSVNVDALKIHPGTYNIVGFESHEFGTLSGNAWDMNEALDLNTTSGLTNGSFAGGTYTATVSNASTGYAELHDMGGEIDAARYKFLSMGVAYSQAGTATISWVNTAGTLMGQQTFAVVQGSNQIDIDMSALGGWSGNVGRLRIHGLNSAGTSFAIDYVALSSDGFVASLATPTFVPAAGTLTINQPPLFDILQPDLRGGEDFAAAVLNDPWDMDAATDINGHDNLKDAAIFPNNFVNGRQGNFFCAANEAGNADPFQWSVFEEASAAQVINADRYKNVTIEGFIDREQDIVNGSVLRIIGWNRDRDSKPFNGDDTIVQSNVSGKEWFTLKQDMTKLLLEPAIHPPGSFVDPIWSGKNHWFRVDMHEFTPSTTFCVDSIEVRADDEANSRFALTYNGSDADQPSATTVNFYYTTNSTPINGQSIASNINMSSQKIVLWDTSGVPNGTYYVYAIANDGYNPMTRMGHRIVINHSRVQDTTVPIASYDEPRNGDEYRKTLRVRGYAYDNIQVAAVQVKMDGQLLGVIEPSLFRKDARNEHPNFADASRAGFDAKFDIQGFALGLHSVEIITYDTAGNNNNNIVLSITRVAGNDLPFATPTPENEATIVVPENGGPPRSPNLTVKVNAKKRLLNVIIGNANTCDEVIVVADDNESELLDNPLAATVLKQRNPTKKTVAYRAKKVNRINFSGERKFYMGLICDGSLARSRTVNLGGFKKGKTLTNADEFFTKLKAKLK